LGLGVVTVCDFRVKVKEPQKPNTLAESVTIKNAKLKTEQIYKLL